MWRRKSLDVGESLVLEQLRSAGVGSDGTSMRNLLTGISVLSSQDDLGIQPARWTMSLRTWLPMHWLVQDGETGLRPIEGVREKST